jgi:hypothetical protein
LLVVQGECEPTGLPDVSESDQDKVLKPYDFAWNPIGGVVVEVNFYVALILALVVL